MNMTDSLIQVVSAFLGTLGFGFLFNIRGKKLFLVALGGMLAWSMFLIFQCFISSEILCYFIVSVIMTLYAEILARIVKTPTTTFCIVSLIPLVPGSALYYTMSFALQNNLDEFVKRAAYTVELSAALSLGIVLVTAGSRYFSKRKK